MTERRYRDDEVRKIFDLATTDKIANPPAARAARGLTLSEMQSIGLEVGIEPDIVARAAAALDSSPPLAVRQSLGMPIEVGVSVPLSQPMTDQQWEMLVVELRRTFRAKGRITTHGNLREWRNGNLHASVEPTEAGYRLRLGTVKGNAAGVNALGAMGLLASVVTWGAQYLIVSPSPFMDVAPLVFGAGGVAALVANWLRMPPWARRREEQMKQIAATAQSIINNG